LLKMTIFFFYIIGKFYFLMIKN